MKKNYIVLASVWLASIVLMGAVIAFIQNSGIMAKFLPQKVLANPDCIVNDSVTIAPPAGGIIRIVPDSRAACGACDVGNKGELAICSSGGACSGYGYNLCTHVGDTMYGWDCLEDIE
jgi:hypothetical protein